jgi:DNA-directed RNA polymerase specialized sigma24 family protein
MDPAKAAAAWRALQTTESREALARSLDAAVRQMLRAMRLPKYAVDEVSQETVMIVLECITRGQATPGNENGFTAICARNAGLRWFRRMRDDAMRFVPIDPARASQPEIDSQTPAGEEEDLSAERLARVHAVLNLPSMPATYREVLIAVYVQGRTVEDLVLADLTAQGITAGDKYPREFALAQNKFHQRLHRAKEWVRRRVEDAKGEGG